MRRHLTLVLFGLAVLAGCGDDEEPPAAAATGAATVAVEEIDGTGQVLVDREGNTLYTAEQEADGTIRCSGGCLAFWQPLTATGDPAPGADVPGELGVVERDDGTRQVTYDGVPVYRFSEDSPGEVTGDGLEDEFGGTTFTWHAITVGEAEESGGGGGYPGY